MVDKKACNQFRLQLMNHLKQHEPNRTRRLCDAWDKNYPLTHQADPIILAEEDQEQGTSNKATSPQQLQPVTQEEVHQDHQEDDEGSWHIPARMDQLPSTQEDATFDDLQEQLDIINTFGSPQADPKVINDFLKEFHYENDFDDTILASLSIPNLATSSGEVTFPQFTGSAYNPKKTASIVLQNNEMAQETITPDSQPSNVGVVEDAHKDGALTETAKEGSSEEITEELNSADKGGSMEAVEEQAKLEAAKEPKTGDNRGSIEVAEEETKPEDANEPNSGDEGGSKEAVEEQAKPEDAKEPNNGDDGGTKKAVEDKQSPRRRQGTKQ